MAPVDAAIPRSWQRALALLLGAALAVYVVQGIAGAVLPFLRRLLDVLTPLLIAFAISYLLHPLVERLVRRGMSRKAGVALVLGALTVAMVLALVLVVPPIVQQAIEMGPRVATYWDEGRMRLQAWLGEHHPQGAEQAAEWLRQRLGTVDWAAVARPVTGWLADIASTGWAVLIAILNLLLVPVLVVYLLADMDRLLEGARALIPAARRERILEPLREIDLALARFMRGQLAVAGVLAALYMLGLWISGTPLGLVIGLFAGIVSFVPYLGLVLGIVPALAFTFLEHGVSWHVVGVVLTFTLAQLAEGWLITPRLVGQTVGLHPVVVIIAVVVGGTFFGLAGMLLAVPATAAGLVLLRRARARWMPADDRPETAPPLPPHPGLPDE